MLAHHLNRPFNPTATTNGWLALKHVQLKHNSRHPTRCRPLPRAASLKQETQQPEMSFGPAGAKLTATATGSKLERQLQLIVPMPLE
jgi:hypothetical protein